MIDSHTPKVINLKREWHIGRRLGQGSFGQVYLAESEVCSSAVVKLIPKSPGADREILFQDLDSVRTNVVPVIDRGEWDGFWVLVMPRAEMSLREYLDNAGGQLSVNSAVHVLIDIVEALADIQGDIVHRDIKPENVLLLDDHWCLADFGISKYADATTAPHTRKYYSTPAYAAPEQWRSDRASSATDVYAFGVVAYELLAGGRPFAGPDDSDFRAQHLKETPEVIQGIPINLRSLIQECLYKGPQSRPNPQNLLTRLKRSVQSTSEAGQRLQLANAIVVNQQAQLDRERSKAISEEERRQELGEAARQSLEHILSLFHDKIIENAPASQSYKGQLTGKWSLNEAELHVDSAMLVGSKSAEGAPFEVVGYSSVTIRTPRGGHGYEGRSHSLWYCDAQDPGVFRWYETAFMINALTFESVPLYPFALKPGRDAYSALSRGMHRYQPAWPFTPIDQGNEDDFIERWMDWFADAAQGNLHNPRMMPERSPEGSWRRRG